MVVVKQAMGQDVMKGNLPCGLLGSTGLAKWKRRLACCTLLYPGFYPGFLLLAAISFPAPQVWGGWWGLSFWLLDPASSVC